MIAVDTNILARFYVDDPTDPEAEAQRPVALRVLSGEPAVFVPVTVLLELEWVLRAFYRFGTDAFIDVIGHLAGLPNVTLEDQPGVLAALDLHRQTLDFADALHLVRSERCERFLTFDDRRFARRATRLGLSPEVEVPT